MEVITAIQPLQENSLATLRSYCSRNDATYVYQTLMILNL